MQNIKLLILDIDGVLTDGKLWFTPQGEEVKAFHTHDGLGIKRLQKAGVPVAVISGRGGAIVSHRMKELSIEHVYLEQKDKLAAYAELKQKLSIQDDAIAYMGDDLPDLPIMTQVGFPVAVFNAVSAVKDIAKCVTQKSGGEGAVREVCDLLLRAYE